MEKEKMKDSQKPREAGKSEVSIYFPALLPEGIFQETRNPQVFIDHFGRLYSLETNQITGDHTLKKLTAFPNEQEELEREMDEYFKKQEEESNKNTRG